MVESDHYLDSVTGLPVHSLYGEVRKPTPAMLDGIDALIFDLQDVGTRVYTFIWTMALAMEACAEEGVRFVVLDRPNPIGGIALEGPLPRPGYESFVGLHPIPLRHGLTCGEMARWLKEERGIGCDLAVIPMRGWERDMLWPDTGLPWVMPSPNLPAPDSCLVYPGMVLLEGTNLSEGRGTTRPFEIFGAPWLDPEALTSRLVRACLPGVRFRPCHFEPTFQKHARRLCGGAQLHVADHHSFEPVRTAIEILVAARELAPRDFSWREPPYEYEETLPPIDILWGSPALARGRAGRRDRGGGAGRGGSRAAGVRRDSGADRPVRAANPRWPAIQRALVVTSSLTAKLSGISSSRYDARRSRRACRPWFIMPVSAASLARPRQAPHRLEKSATRGRWSEARESDA